MEKKKIEAEKRKIRRQIRKAAKEMGISTKEYKLLGAPEISEKPREEEFVFKPYDGLSNKPLFDSLAFGKPKYTVRYESIHGFNHVMRLEGNGHYMPYRKHKSDQDAGLVKVGKDGQRAEV